MDCGRLGALIFSKSVICNVSLLSSVIAFYMDCNAAGVVRSTTYKNISVENFVQNMTYYVQGHISVFSW